MTVLNLHCNYVILQRKYSQKAKKTAKRKKDMQKKTLKKDIQKKDIKKRQAVV